MNYNVGDTIDLWLQTINPDGTPSVPESTPTVEIVHNDSGITVDLAATAMTSVTTTQFRYELTAPSFIGTYCVTYRFTIDGVDALYSETFTVGSPTTVTFWARFVTQEGAQATIKGGTTPEATARYYDGSSVQTLFTAQNMSLDSGLYYIDADLPSTLDQVEVVECIMTATYDDDTVVNGSEAYQGQVEGTTVIATGFDLTLDDEAMLQSQDSVELTIEDESVLETQEDADLVTDNQVTLKT